jgi:ribosomal protein S12 methylthiotransferase
MSGRLRTRDLPVFPVTPGGGPLAGDTGRGAESSSAASAVASEPTAHGGPRIGLVTLGCDKNTVDSERMMAALAGGGGQVQVGVEGADVVVINTCGFIDMAREESIETILEACDLKATGGVKAVVAVGCLVQRYRDELAKEIPEVDLFLGLTEMPGLIPELRNLGLLPDPTGPGANMGVPLRILTSETPHTAHLKISEGCDHSCAFCAIPHMRGLHRSAPVEDLVAEARGLEAQGVREVSIISQDTTWYGRDFRREANRVAGPGGRAEPTPLLPELLRALLAGTEIPWYRLFYMYPSGMTPELVELLASEPRLLPYLDMPIQHGSDAVLKRMRRPERQATILARVAELRAAVPDLVLRTTVIVGFPGETEAEFRDMLDLLSEVRFERVGAFTYSPEEDTPAAEMTDHLSESEKRDRLETLLDLQRDISFECNEAMIGKRETVLVDRLVDDDPEVRAEGRTRGQAAEVDGMTRIVGSGDSGRDWGGAPGASGPVGRLRPGTFVDVEVVEALDYDLIARVVNDERHG